MRWLGLLACLMLVAAWAPAGSGEWTMEGYDAGRTGASRQPGPAFDDVAFRLRLPGAGNSSFLPAPPLIAGGDAYILLSGTGFAVDSRLYVQRSDAYVVDLATAQWRHLATVPFAAAKWSTDGHALYVAGSSQVVALGLDGSVLWRTDLAPVPAARTPMDVPFPCGGPVVLEASLWVACTVELPGFATDIRVAHVAKADGRLLATWDRSTAAPVVPLSPVEATSGSAFSEGLSRTVTGESLFLSLAGDFLLLVVDGSGDYSAAPLSNCCLGGAWLLDVSGPPRFIASRSAPVPIRGMPPVQDFGHVAPPTACWGRFALKFRFVEVWDPASPFQRRSFDVDDGADAQEDHGSGMACGRDMLYVAAPRILQAVGEDLVARWTFRWPNGEAAGAGAPILASNLLFVRTQTEHRPERLLLPSVVYAIEPRGGTVAWRHPLPSFATMALGNGTLALLERNGEVTVLGTTPASLQVRHGELSRYPGLGDLVTLDLGPTLPGALGAATEFMVDWGDGEATGWQASPRFEHRFALPEDAIARLHARNANQSASLAVTFHVGQVPPGRGLLEIAFDREHQETTFFMLGLAVTALAALYGVVRLRRAHGRLARELRALDAEMAACGHAGRSEALARWEARAVRLLAERRLDPSQHAVLQGRIQEVQRRHRMAMVDERLAFLPHGMVRQLEAMLADAKVAGWERLHFLGALDALPDLSAAQRRSARRLVDAWFAQDEAAGRAGGGLSSEGPRA